MEKGNYIAGKIVAGGKQVFKAFDPVAEKELDPAFVEASAAEVEEALQKAADAFQVYRHLPVARRAHFLRCIAQEIEDLGEQLFSRYILETGLSKARTEGETARTLHQLRSFADYIEEGDYLEVAIDHEPTDLRKMLIPIGPIAVFGASNFPLAYSTAGGDTASALAAGCPVIVKSHPMHVGTGNLIAGAIDRAAKSTGMPLGVFSNLNSQDHQIGGQLVRDSRIKGVGFTGSIQGGRALYNLAAERKEPIPVFAEMGSINPVVLLPSALYEERNKWVKAYAQSISLGAGQFCTNPGLILALEHKNLDTFIEDLAKELDELDAQTMIHPVLHQNFNAGLDRLHKSEELSHITPDTKKGDGVYPHLWCCSAKAFMENESLHHEVFGPSSIVVRCEDEQEMLDLIQSLDGQLTASILSGDLDLVHYSALVAALQNRVGRIIFNGVPTGVQVSPAMVHGGPYPASSDSRFTAVGTAAIRRWLRPFSYQSWPKELLPEALQEDNPLEIMRRVDGKLTRS